MPKPDPRFFGNNVYILGAGFSAYAGMPLMSDFMTRMRDIRELTDDLPAEAARAIDLVLEERARLSGVRDKIILNLDNVEDLFSLIDAGATVEQSEKARRLTTSVRKAIATTLLFSRSPSNTVRVGIGSKADMEQIVKILRLEKDAVQPPDIQTDPYRLFSALLLHLLDMESDIRSGADTVITFNYDLVLEDGLKWSDIRPDYCLREKEYSDGTRPTERSIKIVKVHGSVNWEDRGREGVSVVEDANELLASPGGRPLLIPPTWAKGTQTRLSRELWSNAVQAIEKAHRIIVIGYSMPRTDLYFKYMLAAGLRRNSALRQFSVIDPSDMSGTVDEILDATYFSNRKKITRSDFEQLIGSPHFIIDYLGRGRALRERLPD